jgi:hypothetical protein
LKMTLHILYGSLLHPCSDLRHHLESSRHRDFLDATVAALAHPPPERAKAAIFRREGAADEDRPEQGRQDDSSTPTRAQGGKVLVLLVEATASASAHHGSAMSPFCYFLSVTLSYERMNYEWSIDRTPAEWYF